MQRPALLALAATMLFAALAGCSSTNPPPQGEPGPSPSPAAPRVSWGAPLAVGGVGYEPSISCDHTGAMYITAHKDLTRPETWPYLASWILASTDNGNSWHAPTSPGQLHEKFVGDEGDIAVDARGWMYFLDTYLADNHLHVFSDGGDTWQYSVPFKSSQADDRPWLFAQGEGILHYLGNNGAPVDGQRYIYYRSTDGGMTMSPGTGLPFDGWAHGDAQRNGTWAFVAQERGQGPNSDIMAMASNDQGATWGEPVLAGHRDGSPGDGNLKVAVDGLGNPAITWVDGSTVQLGRSLDHGVNWTVTDITPQHGTYDHATLAGHGDAGLAAAVYGTADDPPTADSEWRLWVGLSKGPIASAADLHWQVADPKPLYTGNDRHALHDLFELCATPDGALNVAYQDNLPGGPPNAVDGDRHMWFVRGTVS